MDALLSASPATRLAQEIQKETVVEVGFCLLNSKTGSPMSIRGKALRIILLQCMLSSRVSPAYLSLFAFEAHLLC